MDSFFEKLLEQIYENFSFQNGLPAYDDQSYLAFVKFAESGNFIQAIQTALNGYETFINNVLDADLNDEQLGNVGNKLEELEYGINFIFDNFKYWLQQESSNHVDPENERLLRVINGVYEELKKTQQFIRANDENKKFELRTDISALQFKNAFISGQSDKFNDGPDPEIAPLLEHGPINRSESTVKFEELIKLIISKKPFEIFEYKDEKRYEIKIDGKIYDINQLLKYANLSQLNFSQEDFESYKEMLCDKPKGKINPMLDTQRYQLEGSPTQREHVEYISATLRSAVDQANDPYLKRLEDAEMLAINIYSTNFYMVANPLMRGEVYGALHQRGQLSRSDNLADVLCVCAFAQSGLSKIPDTQIKDNSVTFRGEDNLPDSVQETRDKSLNQAPIDTKGFISTAADKPALNFAFSENEDVNKRIGVVIKVYGKDVSLLSQYPNEREVLSGSSQILYESKRELNRPGEDQETIYTARKVESITGMVAEQLVTVANLNTPKINKLNEKIKVEKTKLVEGKKNDPIKLEKLERKLVVAMNKQRGIIIHELEKVIDKKASERLQPTDDDKLYRLIAEYNERVTISPMLDEAEFNAYIEAIKSFQALSHSDIVDNRNVAEQAIIRIENDKVFASTLRNINKDSSLPTLNTLPKAFSFTNEKRIAALQKQNHIAAWLELKDLKSSSREFFILSKLFPMDYQLGKANQEKINITEIISCFSRILSNVESQQRALQLKPKEIEQVRKMLDEAMQYAYNDNSHHYAKLVNIHKQYEKHFPRSSHSAQIEDVDVVPTKTKDRVQSHTAQVQDVDVVPTKTKDRIQSSTTEMQKSSAKYWKPLFSLIKGIQELGATLLSRSRYDLPKQMAKYNAEDTTSTRQADNLQTENLNTAHLGETTLKTSKKSDDVTLFTERMTMIQGMMQTVDDQPSAAKTDDVDIDQIIGRPIATEKKEDSVSAEKEQNSSVVQPREPLSSNLPSSLIEIYRVLEEIHDNCVKLKNQFESDIHRSIDAHKNTFGGFMSHRDHDEMRQSKDELLAQLKTAIELLMEKAKSNKITAADCNAFKEKTKELLEENFTINTKWNASQKGVFVDLFSAAMKGAERITHILSNKDNTDFEDDQKHTRLK